MVRAVSYQLVDHVRSGQLKLVPRNTSSRAPRPVNLVYDTQSRWPLKLRAFVRFFGSAHARAVDSRPSLKIRPVEPRALRSSSRAIDLRSVALRLLGSFHSGDGAAEDWLGGAV